VLIVLLKSNPKSVVHHSSLITHPLRISRIHPQLLWEQFGKLPGGQFAGCSAGNPVRNPESYLVCYSVSNRASYLERNRRAARKAAWPQSGRVFLRLPGESPASNPQSNLPSNGQRTCSAIRRAVRQIPLPAVWGVLGEVRMLTRLAALQSGSVLHSDSLPSTPPVLPRDHDLRIHPSSPVPRPSPLTKYTPAPAPARHSRRTEVEHRAPADVEHRPLPRMVCRQFQDAAYNGGACAG